MYTLRDNQLIFLMHRKLLLKKCISQWNKALKILFKKTWQSICFSFYVFKQTGINSNKCKINCGIHFKQSNILLFTEKKNYLLLEFTKKEQNILFQECELKRIKCYLKNSLKRKIKFDKDSSGGGGGKTQMQWHQMLERIQKWSCSIG